MKDSSEVKYVLFWLYTATNKHEHALAFAADTLLQGYWFNFPKFSNEQKELGELQIYVNTISLMMGFLEVQESNLDVEYTKKVLSQGLEISFYETLPEDFSISDGYGGIRPERKFKNSVLVYDRVNRIRWFV